MGAGAILEVAVTGAITLSLTFPPLVPQELKELLPLKVERVSAVLVAADLDWVNNESTRKSL